VLCKFLDLQSNIVKTGHDTYDMLETDECRILESVGNCDVLLHEATSRRRISRSRSFNSESHDIPDCLLSYFLCYFVLLMLRYSAVCKNDVKLV